MGHATVSGSLLPLNTVCIHPPPQEHAGGPGTGAGTDAGTDATPPPVLFVCPCPYSIIKGGSKDARLCLSRRTSN